MDAESIRELIRIAQIAKAAVESNGYEWQTAQLVCNKLIDMVLDLGEVFENE